ncbi:caspase family protein [bacterium]|nr:caspase family protein [bacterium]
MKFQILSSVAKAITTEVYARDESGGLNPEFQVVAEIEGVVEGLPEKRTDLPEGNVVDSQIPDAEIEGTTIPDPRPWPDDSQRSGEMDTIYALIVGINDYPTAPLNGCLKDVEQIETYLQGKYPKEKLKIQVLRDSQATYEGIRQGFKTHLTQAGPKDTVWFHFSGHGTEAFAANEFISLEPNGKDQNLVCFDDGKNFLLADKEIAVLLSEVASQDAQGRAKKSPHIVISLDCCHSGSGTRDFGEPKGLKTRNMELIGSKTRDQLSPSDIRPLETYADGYYKKQFDETGKMIVPAARHVLLSACTSVQKAGDLPKGGVFTCSLIDTLIAGQGNLNYADLFMRTRATARKVRDAQTPQFETINNFDPYSQFLAGTPLGTPDRYEVSLKNGRWFVKCGAIHGFPVKSDQPIELEIQSAAPDNKPVAKAHLTAVGAQESPFDIDEGTLDAETFYHAVIRHLPAAPITVWLHGDVHEVNKLINVWDASKNILYVTDTARQDECQLEVEAVNNKFIIKDRRTRRQVETLTWSEKDTQKVIKDLAIMAKWERTLDLDNEASKIREWVDFDLGYMDSQMTEHHFTSPEIKLYASADNFFYDEDNGSLGIPFIPTMVVKKTTTDLYGYLFHMRSDYSIESYEGEIVFRTEEHPNKNEVRLPMWTGQWGWGLSKDDIETVSYFKMLVTTEPLDHQQLLQSGLKDFRDLVFKWKKVSVKDDWFSETYKVTLVRQWEPLADKAVTFANSNLTLQPHATVRCKAGLASGLGFPASQDPACKFGAFDVEGFRMMDLVSDVKKLPSSVLELTDLQGVNDTLKDNPLKISIAGDLADGETLVPVVFDGKDFRVAGTAKKEGNGISVSITALPTSLPGGTEKVKSPFSEIDNMQDASLYSAAKVGFFVKSADTAIPEGILSEGVQVA